MWSEVKVQSSKLKAQEKFQFPTLNRRPRRLLKFGACSPELLLTFALWILSCGSCVVRAETALLTPIADTTLLEVFPTNNFGGNEYFNSGTTQNYTTNRGLMKFDIAGSIPSGATITYVSLTLEVVWSPVDGDTPSNFSLHRLRRDWGEGNKKGHPPQQSGLGQPATINEATWFHRFAFTSNTWALPGGAAGIDYEPASSSETFIYGMNFSPYLFDSTPRMMADVQTWLDKPEDNFGWMLLTDSETNNFTARRFASREDAFKAPVLAVDYFGPPRIERIVLNGESVNLHFVAEAGRAYAVEYCNFLEGTDWLTLTNISPQPATTNLVVPDDVSAGQRYYRLLVE
jgi:hypothetical protein